MRKIGSITLCVSILTLILVLSTLVVVAGNANVSMVSESKSENPSKSLTSHDPICIDGNSNFASQASSEGWAGDGTINNPYIIENYDINASSAIGIEIRNTDKYFIIRNCMIHNGKSSNKHGIYFYSVQNGKIDNVTSYDNSGGIYLSSSLNNNITNCKCYNHSDEAIWLWESSDNQITNCACYNNDDGIRLEYSSDNTITNCMVQNNTGDGICIADCPNSILQNN
ncbi:MAG: right-handed parallel beta-helix repeat-containing protein, partial [Thermoplasmatales archaeon]|nr:right-handed parallel beta-helix repeat-containing protein [Thermoplasmatales archaeon]